MMEPMHSPWLRKKGDTAWMMGVLNCTPDSFSDGGRYTQVEQAVQHGLDMWQQGAALIDVGGESTRPGAREVSVEEEQQRVLPVIRALVAHGCKVSIDTRKAAVMHAAIDAGACMVNDVTALTYNRESLPLLAASGVDVCLMHMQGTPENMQVEPSYEHVVDDVRDYLEQRVEACVHAGIAASSIILDPGIGFGKRLQDNLDLLMQLDVLKQYFKLPLLLGVSRKSLIAGITGAPVGDRELETGILDSLGIYLGADGVRVHDVAQQKRACVLASMCTDVRMNHE